MRPGLIKVNGMLVLVSGGNMLMLGVCGVCFHGL